MRLMWENGKIWSWKHLNQYRNGCNQMLCKISRWPWELNIVIVIAKIKSPWMIDRSYGCRNTCLTNRPQSSLHYGSQPRRDQMNERTVSSDSCHWLQRKELHGEPIKMLIICRLLQLVVSTIMSNCCVRAHLLVRNYRVLDKSSRYQDSCNKQAIQSRAAWIDRGI